MLRLNSLLLCLACGLLCAQDDTPTFRTDTREVVLHTSVFDKSGKLISSLTRNDFKVYENDKLQPLKYFKREDVPVSLGIIIDNSGSMRNKRQRVEAAAMAFVKASNRQDEVFLVNFDEDAYLDVPMTNSLEKLEEGLTKINSKGGTAMRDAVSMSLDHLKAEGKKDKRVLLVITDGNDTASAGITLEKLVEKAQRSEYVIYAIGLLTEEDKSEARKAKRALDALAAASGGATYYPESPEDVEKTCLQVAHDIRNQFTLVYSPTNQNLDGTFRRIKVTAGNGKYVARTRSGYYATPDDAAKKKTSALTPATPATSAKK